MPSVVQEWVHDLPIMQQSVLLAAIRGPDGLPKNHVSKFVLRWYRRCVLLSALHGKPGVGAIIARPDEEGGGSFTGPSCGPKTPYANFFEVVDAYFDNIDEVPHHFQLHLMHAAQILCYKHPSLLIRAHWCEFYLTAVADMHLHTESEYDLDARLAAPGGS